MAEELLITGVGEIVKELGSVAASQIAQAWGVKDEAQKLQRTSASISGLLEDAEKRQVEDKSVGLWLKDLKEVAYDARDVLDEFTYESLKHKVKIQNSKVRNFFSLSIVFRFKMARKIKKINERLDEIDKNKSRFQFKQAAESSKSGEIRAKNRETSSYVDDSEIFGRENERSEIVKMLTSSENQSEILSVIPIVGMGGLGKTTLAQSVYNDKLVEKHFDTRIWVCVSDDDFDVKRILKEIMESVQKNRCDTLSLDVMLRKLQGMIGGKRFLLVLDDVWNEDRDKWDRLAASLKIGASGSKIIVTTRSAEVASIMGTLNSRIYDLHVLSKDDCWSLFERRAFGNGGVKETPNLVAIGREIVNKCGGLPLAVKALGGLLRSKKEEREWLFIQESDLWKLSRVDRTGILPALKLSYDHLASPVKQCFLYCSLFPKDSRIDKESLIRQWAAHGFLQPFEGSTLLMEDVGDEYFNILVWNSFFQDVEKDGYGNTTYCKMHDLVHDLALSISRSEYSTVDGDQVEDVFQVRHMLFKAKFEGVLPIAIPKSLIKAEKLRTFIFNRESSMKGYVNINMLMHFKCLHVLDLSDSPLKELPSSIGELKHLRYLDLSFTRIKVLPKSITNLHNLQTFRLISCPHFEELPRNMRKLISLRHLETHDTSIQRMRTKIGQLTNLQTLSRYLVGKSTRCGIKELASLNNLRGNLEIYCLENVRNGIEAKEANLQGKPNIELLLLSWKGMGRYSSREFYHRNDGDVLEWLQPHRNLKRL